MELDEEGLSSGHLVPRSNSEIFCLNQNFTAEPQGKRQMRKFIISRINPSRFDILTAL
jgi:hypothetical protein